MGGIFRQAQVVYGAKRAPIVVELVRAQPIRIERSSAQLHPVRY